MVTKCIVPNCGNACNAKLSVTLFSFPKDLKLVQKWIHATRAHYLKEIKSHHKVCSDHFEKQCILNHFGATRLTPGAIPTIFEWNRSTNERAHHAAPILAIRNLNSYSISNNRITLPKPIIQGSTNPKLILPRDPQLVSTKSRLNLVKSEPLMCDVILPKRKSASDSSNPPASSAIILYEDSSSNLTSTIQDAEDDECSDGSEYIIGNLGNYTLSTKLPRDYDEKVMGEIQLKSGVSKQNAHDSSVVEDESQGFSNYETSMIEDMPESLQDDSDHFRSVKDPLTFSPTGSSLIEDIDESLHDDSDHFTSLKDVTISPSGEVVIEECSIIEEKIIPPEKACTPLPLSVLLQDEIDSTTTKKDTGGREILRTSKSKQRMLQPRVGKVGAQLVTPHVAYLIPLRGVMTPTVAVKSTNHPVKDKPMISESGQNITSDATKRNVVSLHRTNQKKRISRNPGNSVVLRNTISAPSSVHSSCIDERSKVEKRYSQKLREVKIALRKKDILVKKLLKDKLHLTHKLAMLRRAFLHLKKNSVVNKSPSMYLKLG